MVPDLPTHSHRFDWLGVVLSAAGLFCLVFGLQEGRAHDWGRIAGPITVWGLIGMGVVLLGVFVGWQAINRAEPLLPLSLLRDRNFSLANTGIALVGFTVTAMPFPLMIWAQAVRGFSPTRAALILAPMAVVTGVLAPRVGRLVDRAHPRVLTSFGFGLFAVTLFGLSRLLTPDSPIVLVLLAFALLGLASSFVWSPLGATATANLPVRMAGAGSGIYNTTRQVGAVVGSAAIAAMMESRLAARIPEEVTGGSAGSPAPGLGPSAGLSEAMADSLLLPAAAIGLGLIVALWFVRPSHQNQVGAPRPDELPVPGRTPSATPAAGSSR